MTAQILRVLSYNIHKGFSFGNQSLVLDQIKESIDLVGADLVFLQEVVGQHERHQKKHENWPADSQFEYLADKVWPHFAYGKNAVYQDGHHGNAILSKYPITSFENINISTNRLEQRGILHAAIQIPGLTGELHALCLHLDLLERGRQKQLAHLCRRIEARVPAHAPVVIGGDFNDWGERASSVLQSKLGVAEVFLEQDGAHARTFPAWLPALRLDRIYFKGLELIQAKTFSDGIWRRLSDHAAVYAELSITR